MNAALPQTQQYLRRFVRARRSMAVLRAIARAASLAMLWLLAWGLVDRSVQLPATIRLMLLIMLAAITAWLLVRPFAAAVGSTIDWHAAALLVEDRDPRFGERLATVVSQVDETSGASPQLAARLAQEVESIIARQPLAPVRLVGIRPLIIAWSVAIVAIAIMLALSLWPWLGLRELVARQLKPMSDAQPVTTTHLVVTPGSIQIASGDGVTIIARSERGGGDGATLRVSSDGGRTWTTSDMSAASDSAAYVQTISAVSRDMLYEVTAGDATAGPFEIRVARPVAVSESAPATPTTQSTPAAQYHDALEAYFRALGQINPAETQP